jgi:hypothetical protein
MTLTKVTPTTGLALRKVFALLEDNFDTGEGQYLHGYDDARVAKETGISEAGVKEYRTSAFGKLKPPTELHKVKQDLSELESAFLKLDAEIREKIKDLKQRVLVLQRRFD